MTTLSIQPATSTDDGHWGTGSGYNAAIAVIVGGYYGTANGWFRVANVTIASGSTISDFRLRGTPVSANGTADMKFYFVKEANPTYPTSGSDADGRTKTTAYVTGSYSGTGAFTSANCATPAQEVVDQGTWASGNSQIFYALDDNSNTNHGGFENRINFYSYDYGSNLPSLDWTYSSSIQAAVPAGTISFTGVAPTVRKSAPVVVGSVTFTGVTPTVPTAIQAAVVVGTITLTGVALTTKHSAPIVVGTVALAGISPASSHRAAITVGAATFTGVALTVPVAGSVVPGTITIAGVTPDTRHAAAVSIGAVAFTGVEPATKHQAAVSVGTISLTGVALTSVHYAGVSIGSVAIAGVVPGSTHRAAVVVGSAVFMGVALGSRHTAAVSVGSVVFGFGVHVASIQDINFNGSTIGSALVMFGASPGLFDANPAGDDLTGWQTAVNTLVFPLTATVSLITGGFRITFADTDFHPAITISVDGTNLGLTTITQTQIGGNYFPVSVRKDVGVSVGTFALTGVLPATRHRAAVEVGSVVFAGVTPTANYGIAVPGPFIAVAWANWQPDDKAGTNWQPGDVAGDSYQPGDKAGTNL